MCLSTGSLKSVWYPCSLLRSVNTKFLDVKLPRNCWVKTVCDWCGRSRSYKPYIITMISVYIVLFQLFYNLVLNIINLLHNHTRVVISYLGRRRLPWSRLTERGCYITPTASCPPQSTFTRGAMGEEACPKPQQQCEPVRGRTANPLVKG